MTTFAGQFGPYTLIDTAGNSQAAATVTVRNAANAANVTVYASRTKTALANPLPTGVATGAAGVDASGVVTFWVDPGNYTVRVLVGATTTEYPVTVDADPVEVSTAYDAAGSSAAAQAAAVQRANHTGTQSADTLTDGTTNKAFLATERTKLTGVATGATANSSDVTLLARANHTGTQAAGTITGLGTAATVNTGTASGCLLYTSPSPRDS